MREMGGWAKTKARIKGEIWEKRGATYGRNGWVGEKAQIPRSRRDPVGALESGALERGDLECRRWESASWCRATSVSKAARVRGAN